MKHRPAVVAFDVTGTLFGLEPIGSKLHEIGLPTESLSTWIARTLRDGMALELNGQFHSFGEVAHAVLEAMMAEHHIEPAEQQLQTVISGLSDLPPYEDVYLAFDRLRSLGVRVIAITNGGASATKKLFGKAGLSDRVERIVSIDDVRRWKPSRAVYLHAAQTCHVEVHQIALVSAHAWDIVGAAAAGFTTAWVPRREKRYPSIMPQPNVKGGTLLELVERLLSLPLRPGKTAP